MGRYMGMEEEEGDREVTREVYSLNIRGRLENSGLYDKRRDSKC